MPVVVGVTSLLLAHIVILATHLKSGDIYSSSIGVHAGLAIFAPKLSLSPISAPYTTSSSGHFQSSGSTAFALDASTCIQLTVVPGIQLSPPRTHLLISHLACCTATVPQKILLGAVGRPTSLPASSPAIPPPPPHSVSPPAPPSLSSRLRISHQLPELNTSPRSVLFCFQVRAILGPFRADLVRVQHHQGPPRRAR